MDPQVAIQLILTLAKITGTVLAMYMAVIIFALRDRYIAQVILRDRSVRLALMTIASAFFLSILWDIVVITLIDLGNPFDDIIIFSAILLFVFSFLTLFGIFWVLISAKRKSLT